MPLWVQNQFLPPAQPYLMQTKLWQIQKIWDRHLLCMFLTLQTKKNNNLNLNRIFKCHISHLEGCSSLQWSLEYFQSPERYIYLVFEWKSIFWKLNIWSRISYCWHNVTRCANHFINFYDFHLFSGINFSQERVMHTWTVLSLIAMILNL